MAKMSDAQRKSLVRAVQRCHRAAEGDSNDEEIEALRVALEEALAYLDMDYWELTP